MKLMYPYAYPYNGFVATHALGHTPSVHHASKCMSCRKAIVMITGRAHRFHDCIYILRPSRFCEI